MSFLGRGRKQQCSCPRNDAVERRRFPVVPTLIGLLAATNVASVVLMLIE
jgi:hypothetical protein